VAAAEAAGVASASAPSRSAPQATSRKIANRSTPATAAGLTGVDQIRLVLGVTEASSGRDARGHLPGGAVAPQRFRSSDPDLLRCGVSRDGVDESNGRSPIDNENSASNRARVGVPGPRAAVRLLFGHLATPLSIGTSGASARRGRGGGCLGRLDWRRRWQDRRCRHRLVWRRGTSKGTLRHEPLHARSRQNRV